MTRNFIITIGAIFSFWVLAFLISNPKKIPSQEEILNAEILKVQQLKTLDKQRANFLIYTFVNFLEKPKNIEKGISAIRFKQDKKLVSKEYFLSKYSKNSKEVEVSFFLDSIDYTFENNRIVQAKALIQFQRKSSFSQILSSTMEMSFDFIDQKDFIPTIDFVEIRFVGKSNIKNLKSTYSKNKSLSFVYYWLVLHNSKSYSQYRVQTFLRISEQSHQVNPMENGDFSNWFHLIALEEQEWKKFEISSIRHEKISENQMTVSFNLEWVSIDEKGNFKKGKAHQDWILKDDGKREFPIIEKFNLSLMNRKKSRK